MADITMCSPPKFKKKCATCYRMTARPDYWQSYANLSNPCQYMPESHSIRDEANKHIIQRKSDKPNRSKRQKGKHDTKRIAE